MLAKGGAGQERARPRIIWVFEGASGTNREVERRTSFRNPAAGRLAARLGLVFCLLVAGCDSAPEAPVRREPWRKDALALQRAEQTFLRYRAAGGQGLSLSIQTKQVSLRGQVPLEHAELELDPRGLDSAHGTLTFDLERLTLERVTGGEGEGAAPGGDLLLTEAARLWLSLGPDITRKERSERRTAQFQVRLGRSLSSHSVQGGGSVPKAREQRRAGGAARRVSGIVEGDLLLLGKEVTHVVSADVDFFGASLAELYAQPERLVVHLARPDTVPLAEHGIVPRDARGAVVTEQLAGLGRTGSLRAVVTGSLRFELERD